MSTIRSYDLSIISDQEAADRLGMLAAESEDFGLEGAEEDIREGLKSAGLTYAYARGITSRALDVLALRKAQVALSRLQRAGEIVETAYDCGDLHNNLVDLLEESNQ